MNKTLKPSSTLLYFSIIFSLILFMSSCRTPKELVYKDFKNLKFDNVGFTNTLVKFDLVYYNPNNIGLQLKRTDLDVYVDGTYLGKTSQDYQISIPKLKDFTIPLSINVDMKNVLKNLSTTLFNKEVTVKLAGTVKVGKANIFKTFPVNYEGKHKLSM